MISRDPVELFAQAREGSRVALARLLTYVESGGPLHRQTVAEAYRTPAPYVVGITGPPGAGKSTLTDRLITEALNTGSFHGAHPFGAIAILAVDPTSPFTGGAILGDRVRMQEHATDERVFIRSMATRGHLGGLSLAVPDAVRVLGSVGFSVVLVETVGVGQMEVEIASAADTTIVVTIPGAGDSMQANKAGLLEVADLFVINKADRPDINSVRRDLEQMLDLGGEREWRPTITETVATDGRGLTQLWEEICTHRDFLESGDQFMHRRRLRTRVELQRVLSAVVANRVSQLANGDDYEAQVARLVAGEVDPYTAADVLLGS